MPKRNLSIRKNSRSNKNKNKIPKKSKKQVIKKGVKGKGKKGVNATKKQVKNKKKTQKGGSRVKKTGKKKGTVGPGVSTSTARKDSSSPKSPTGLATPQSLKKIFGEHVASRGPMQLRDPDIREAAKKQKIKEVMTEDNKDTTFTLDDIYDQLVNNGLDDLSASIPTVDELLKEREALQDDFEERELFINREVNDINNFLPYHLTEQFNADMTDENLVTKVRAIATKMWDPSTRYTNAKENTGALGMLRKTYVETELGNPANQVIKTWAGFYIQNRGTNGIDNTRIATIPEAIRIIQSSLNYNYKHRAPVWSYIRGHLVPYSEYFPITTSGGGAEKNLVGGAGRGCDEANSLEHLIAYLGGLFSGVLASEKLKKIFEDFIDKTMDNISIRERLKKLMSICVLFLHPRECEDTNVAKSNQPLIKPYIYINPDRTMLAQFVLVPPQYFTNRVGLKTSGSVGWWGLEEWNGSFKYIDSLSGGIVGKWDKKSYRKNGKGFKVDADGNKYPLIRNNFNEEVEYELQQIEPDFTKTTFTDGGWYQDGNEKLSREEVKINQNAYINATLSIVNKIIQDNPLINDFFIAFWALINRENPIPRSSTNRLLNNTGPVNQISRANAVQMARRRIQLGIQGVPDKHVDKYFNPEFQESREEEMTI